MSQRCCIFCCNNNLWIAKSDFWVLQRKWDVLTPSGHIGIPPTYVPDEFPSFCKKYYRKISLLPQRLKTYTYCWIWVGNTSNLWIHLVPFCYSSLTNFASFKSSQAQPKRKDITIYGQLWTYQNNGKKSVTSNSSNIQHLWQSSDTVPREGWNEDSNMVG